jgi:hypothetical protein
MQLLFALAALSLGASNGLDVSAENWTAETIMRHFDIPAGTSQSFADGEFGYDCQTPPGSSYDRCEGFLHSSDMYRCRLVGAILLFSAWKNDARAFTYTITCNNGLVRGEYSQTSHSGNLNQLVDGSAVYNKGIGF